MSKFKTEPKYCPQCHRMGYINKLRFVYYGCKKALSTCENKKCSYFETNSNGNPIKYKLDDCTKQLIPEKQTDNDFESIISENYFETASTCTQEEITYSNVYTYNESSFATNHTNADEGDYNSMDFLSLL